MKKNLMIFLALVLVVGCALLVACGGDDPVDTTAPVTTAPAAPSVLESVTLDGLTATYDGTAKSIAVAGAPADATVAYTVNGAAVSAVSVTDAGTYTVVATVTAGSETVTKTATITINKAAYALPAGVEYFASATVPYDGLYHMPEALAELPAGVAFTADGAPVLNAGDTATYTINFSFSDAAMAKNYLAPAAIEGITLTVAKADIDVSGVVFEDVTIPYDGQYHGIAAPTNLPEQLVCTVSRGGVERGEYTITATFRFVNTADAANYNLPAPITATLTIGAGYINMPEFDDKTFPYNGSNRVPVVPAIEGIASSTVVIKKDGQVVDEAKIPGVYTIEISFTVADTEAYLPVEPVSYQLTVTKATIAGLEAPTWGPATAWDVETANGGYFQYAEGVAHDVKATLPVTFIGHDVTVTYTHTLNGQVVTDTSLPGLYTTTATITLNSDTYVLPEDYTLGSFTWLVADKTVNADDIVFNVADKTFDNAALDFSWNIDAATGVLGSSYILLDAEGNEITEAIAVGTYKIVITFVTDAANGYAPLTVEKTVVITPAVIDLSGIVAVWDMPEAKFFYYDGQMKTVKLSDETIAALADLGVTVSGYTDNAKAATGDYTAVANLTCDANFELSQNTLEIVWGIATPDDDVWSDVTVK